MRAWIFVVACVLVGCGGRASRSDTFVRLERTECLGDCPVYTVTLYDDGTAVYEGRRLAPAGTHTRRVAPDEVRRLIEALARIPAWRCEPERIVTDYPSAIVVVSRDGEVVRIVDYYGDPCAPQELRVLEAEIDRAGGHPHYVPSCPDDSC